MKVLLISPGIDNKYGRILIETNKVRRRSPTLALPYLAAVTPPDIEVKVIDEEHGLMTEYEEADLVGITGMTMHANRMYKIADHYREVGIPVVLGGIHVTYQPDEAASHADAVVIGEAEETWPLLLKDFRNGGIKPVYKCVEAPSLAGLPFARLDLMDGPAYRPPNGFLDVIMTTRGCPNNCNFCCVTKMFGRRFRTKPVDEVIAEIKQMGNGPLFFNDDNIIGSPKYARELFTALKPLNKHWGSQTSIQIANNLELLKLARNAGLEWVLLGIESVNPKNIVWINKKSVNAIEKYGDNIKRMHDLGIKILGSFIVGLDNDDESVFEHIYEFVIKNEIERAVIANLTPFPGTEIYTMFEEQGRIIDRNWDKYNFCNVVIKPKKMTPDQLETGFNNLLKRLNQFRFRRMMEIIYT